MMWDWKTMMPLGIEGAAEYGWERDSPSYVGNARCQIKTWRRPRFREHLITGWQDDTLLVAVHTEDGRDDYAAAWIAQENSEMMPCQVGGALHLLAWLSRHSAGQSPEQSRLPRPYPAMVNAG